MKKVEVSSCRPVYGCASFLNVALPPLYTFPVEPCTLGSSGEAQPVIGCAASHCTNNHYDDDVEYYHQYHPPSSSKKKKKKKKKKIWGETNYKKT
eukprot:NODE_17920_length_919_cov_11.338384.p2 GENE.NODE_17920_length_919_cov_11.338384~~NODE_17920_length_919_cov_11.338384.p2  ORF type:complete len:95 (-),score=27.23 NODE_17920_length_919_cov_11.338384:74-358(-)